MGSADLHIHTTASDGLLDPCDVVEYAAEKTDLNVIAITDHDTMEGAWRAWRWLQAHPSAPIELLWGVEITGAWFRHLLFFWPDRPPRRLPRRLLPPARLIAQMRETGALWVAPHPTNPISLSVRDLRSLAAQGLAPDAVEVCNPALGRRREIRVRRLACDLGLGTAGGSDTHGLLATIGAAYTEFPGCSREHLVDALRRHTTRGAWNPLAVHTPLSVLARQILRAWIARPGLLQRTR
jgi:predicted metal-dependent phosphoesterase TrpH